MAVIDVDEYCRAVEAHLCRRNQGHLIRIVGPAFDVVRGWAEQGLPLSVVMAGVDRYVERQALKARRRPVRIEFCEADVLDAFDTWRRAVGVPAALSPGPRRTGADGARAARGDSAAPATGSATRPADEPDADEEAASSSRRRLTLAAHVERSLARLTAMRGSDPHTATLAAALDAAVRGLDGLLAEARRARGEARDTVIARLAALDGDLGRAVREAVPAAEAVRLRTDAERELAPFRARMDDATFGRALDAAVERAARQRLGVPRLGFD